jgi:hypothetical protein
MSRAKKLFDLIEKKLADVVLCQDMLVLIPSEHILRGFLIENTTEKGRIYLWRVVTPLYRRMRRVVLECSTRIPGRDLYIDSAALARSASEIGDIIRDHLEYLRGVRTPQDFLKHVDWMIGNDSISFRFDLALTYYLTGDIGQCRDVLRTVKADVERLDRKLQLPIDFLIMEAARQFETDPSTFGLLLHEWEQKNVETLGLLPSRPVPAL